MISANYAYYSYAIDITFEDLTWKEHFNPIIRLEKEHTVLESEWRQKMDASLSMLEEQKVEKDWPYKEFYPY